MYDKDTLHEYSQVRKEILSDMNRYKRFMSGDLKGKELDDFKQLNKRAVDLQKELDRQYRAKANIDWDKWNRFHN